MVNLLQSPMLLICSHADMTINIARTLANYKLYKDFSDNDYAEIAGILLEYISQRCKEEDLISSYKLFLLTKIETAFIISLGVKRPVVYSEEDTDKDLLDIPIEEFQDAQIDEEFVRKINNE